MKKERKEHYPHQVQERHIFNQFFTRNEFNPVQQTRDEKLADLYQMFRFQLEMKKKSYDNYQKQ